jgi:rare lipoprotein A
METALKWGYSCHILNKYARFTENIMKIKYRIIKMLSDGGQALLKNGLRSVFMLAALGVTFASGPVTAAQSHKKNPKICGESQLLGEGRASWYGPGFHGRKTANGEVFNMNAMTAAHKTLPLGTYLHVENPETGVSHVVRVNDRGPYIKGRVLDLSKQAAIRLGLEEQGVGKVIMRRCL